MTSTPLRSFDLARTYPVPPERVWAAFTDADLLRRWVCPDPAWQVSSCEVEAHVGGGYRISFGPAPTGDAFHETATYTVFEPVEHLVLDVRTTGEGMAETTRCTVRLVPTGDATRLDLTVEGLSGPEVAEQLRIGWGGCLDGIATVLVPAD